MTPHRLRGFTLIELAIVLALAGIMAALSVAALSGIKNRASFHEATGSLVSDLRRTRAEAFGLGRETVFIVDTVGGRWWGIEAPVGFDLGTFDPSAPGTVFNSGRLPTGVSFGPTAGYGVSALDLPFAGIPVAAGGTFPAYCSFCRTTGPNQGFGAAVFEPGGRVRFPTGDATVGQLFTVTGNRDGVIRTLAVAIVARTGLTQTFER